MDGFELRIEGSKCCVAGHGGNNVAVGLFTLWGPDKSCILFLSGCVMVG